MKLGKLKTKLIIISLLITGAYAEGGFYAGIGAGYTNMSNTAQSPGQFSNGSTSQSAGAPTGNLYAGYDFNKVVGLEANYLAAINATTSSYSATQQLIGASLLLHFPFGIINDSLSGLSVFGRGGIDYNSISFSNNQTCSSCINVPGSANGFTPRYGLGAEYGVKNLGYRLEWDYAGNLQANQGPAGVNVSSNTYLISVLYHF